MNYNYSNFTNPQQYITYGKNLTSKMYNSNPQNKMVQNKLINQNNNNIYLVNNNKIENNINYVPKPAIRKKKGNTKKVKFNNKVCVINVECYKEFNKIDDNAYLNDFFNDKINNSAQDKTNAQKTKNCECNII